MTTSRRTDWRSLLLRSFLAGVGSQLARELVRRVTR